MSSNKLNVRKILAMLATAVFTVGLTGCLGREEPITTTEPEPIVTDVPWEDYFNNNPISVTIDFRFTDEEEARIIQLLNEFDDNVFGIKFEILNEFEEHNKNHINIFLDDENSQTGDKNATGTIVGAAYSESGVGFGADGNITSYRIGGHIYLNADYIRSEGAHFENLFNHELGHIFKQAHSEDENDIMFHTINGQDTMTDFFIDINNEFTYSDSYRDEIEQGE